MANRKERAKQRCQEYYRSDKGKHKKKTLNQRRYKQGVIKNPRRTSSVSTICQIGPYILDANILDFLQKVTTLIEGRKVTQKEIIDMLKKKWRQCSMHKAKRIDYAVSYLMNNPP